MLTNRIIVLTKIVILLTNMMIVLTNRIIVLTHTPKQHASTMAAAHQAVPLAGMHHPAVQPDKLL